MQSADDGPVLVADECGIVEEPEELRGLHIYWVDRFKLWPPWASALAEWRGLGENVHSGAHTRI